MKSLTNCFFIGLVIATTALHPLRAAPPVTTPGKTTPLFDGRTLNGWEGDTRLWRVQDGTLTGGSLTEMVKHNDFLATTRDYTNFIVRMQIRLTGRDGFINSGFQIRSQRVPKSSEMAGYQCDYGDPTWWGCIYDESRRNKVLSPSDMTALGPVIKRNDWNEYVIRAEGARITTWINGVQGTDYLEPDPAIPDHGKLGIQVHGDGKALVQVKEITLEELALTPSQRFVGAPEPAKSTNSLPLSADEEQKMFTLAPGFQIELVASESGDIGKFVTVDWDIKGRMWSMTALEYPVDANENASVAQALYASAAKDKVLVWDTPFAAGPHRPRVFAEGLAIPLGILPYKNGVYVQHGPEIVFLADTDSDGKADRREIILSGFGVQDSHLFPHQFTRGPGGWVWMAQGAFNYGKVKTTQGTEQQFDRTRMARFRYDGSEFDITSQGPCNIWGLVLTPEGECFIQEANDYGYPVMPFHAHANYPGCSDALFKSYAPEFPGTAPDFRMGGTGLSGLALSDRAHGHDTWPEPYANVMYVANPITRKIQAIKLHSDGPRYRLQKLPDFVQSSDEMFRPVAIKMGPDGCLYIVDWYNKIISHNEVPRNHPERDKKRGRIWRVKHETQRPMEVPDFSRLSPEMVLSKLGGPSDAQSHLAWQTIVDRQLSNLAPELKAIVGDGSQHAGRRVAALWALEGLRQIDTPILEGLLHDPNRNIRREAVRALGEASIPPKEVVSALGGLRDELDPDVRAEMIRSAGALAGKEPSAVALCVQLARPALAQPTAKSTQSGKTIKAGPAYEREFERYLARLFLERSPDAVAVFLDSDAAKSLPVENRILATLALEGEASATQLAKLLPGMERVPDDEEVLRLAQFTGTPGVGEALQALLQKPATQLATLQALTKDRTRLDATKLAPTLEGIARRLLAGDASEKALALRLASAFQLTALENDIAKLTAAASTTETILAGIRALREMKASQPDTLAILAKAAVAPSAQIHDEAIVALAESRNELAPGLIIKLWPELTWTQRRTSLERLAGAKVGAQAIVGAVGAGLLDKADLEGALLDKLSAVLPEDKALQSILQELATFLRPVLRFNGDDDAWLDSDISLSGPFTVETWVKLDPGISNDDGILGAPGVLDINFAVGLFRVWAGKDAHDVIIAKKPTVHDAWTHLAVTRDATGKFRIYQNGELDSDKSKVAPQPFEHLRIGWTNPGRGTAGALTEFRVWNRDRAPDEIRADFDRSFEGETRPPGLTHYFPGGGPWGKLPRSVSVQKTRDFPSLLTSDEARVQAERFSKVRSLTTQAGDTAHGKVLFTTICLTCHNVSGQGAQIGPVLSGAGAMGTEALLRAILTPNAAMEAGYRLFRVELTGGDVVDGLLVSQDKEAILLRRPNSEDQRIPMDQVKRAGYTKTSVMPEGLLDALKNEDVADLFTYLKTLK